MGKKFVQRFALIDASNFYAPALVSSFHMEILEALLEPFAELLLELLLQPFETLFEESYALLKRSVRDGDRLCILDLHCDLHRPAEQLDPPAPGCAGDELRPFQSFQHSFDLIEIGKIVHPLRPAAQLSHGLGAPQHQHAEQRHFPPSEIQNFAKAMGKLFYAMACAAYANHKMLVLKCFERLFHRPFIKLHHWIAARFLIAGIL